MATVMMETKDAGGEIARDARRPEALTPASIFAGSMLILVLGALTAAMAQKPASVLQIRGVSDPCDSVSCVAPRQVITTDQAIHMKRRLGNHVLMVDIDRDGARLPGMPADVHATFVQGTGPSGLEFRIDFGDNVDDALRAAKMRHEDAVIVFSSAPETAVLAALLLQERGYSRVLVARERVRTVSGM